MEVANHLLTGMILQVVHAISKPVAWSREKTHDDSSTLKDEPPKKGPLGCLGYIGDEKLPSYMGIIMNHYKDPY